jgi:hypothetical protein
MAIHIGITKKLLRESEKKATGSFAYRLQRSSLKAHLADRRRDHFKDRTGARILLLLLAACGLFWVGIFSLIF